MILIQALFSFEGYFSSDSDNENAIDELISYFKNTDTDTVNEIDVRHFIAC